MSYESFYLSDAAKLAAAVEAGRAHLDASATSSEPLDESIWAPIDRWAPSATSSLIGAMDSTMQSFTGDIHPVWQAAPAEVLASVEQGGEIDTSRRPVRCSGYGGALSGYASGRVRIFGDRWVHCALCKCWVDLPLGHPSLVDHVESDRHLAAAVPPAGSADIPAAAAAAGEEGGEGHNEGQAEEGERALNVGVRSDLIRMAKEIEDVDLEAAALRW